MRTGSSIRVPSEAQLQKAFDTVLETIYWPETLEAGASHLRVHDDCDGDAGQALWVYLGRDADVHLTTAGVSTLRFREPFGGGMSPRVRNALLVLAEAIRRDNEKHPQNFGAQADRS